MPTSTRLQHNSVAITGCKFSVFVAKISLDCSHCVIEQCDFYTQFNEQCEQFKYFSGQGSSPAVVFESGGGSWPLKSALELLNVCDHSPYL